VNGKNVLERENSIKGSQSNSSAEISLQQKWWILCTNVMGSKKNKNEFP